MRQPQVDLPKGGGALRSIGEKFVPDLHTGTANLTVPIETPEGRNGFGPELRLEYSSGNGNGLFGVGWRLGVPEIARRTSRGVPRYESSDVFVLSGTEDLVLVGTEGGIERYRPRTESLFALIERRGDHWRVAMPDGKVSIYGTPGAEWDPAGSFDPADDRRRFSWRLTRTTDAFGNVVDYRYDRDLATGECRLASVHYVDYEVGGTPGYLIEVAFRYERRPDPFVQYRAGFAAPCTLRCHRIEVSSHAPAEQPVRAYALTYADERGVANGASLLSRVVEEGWDGSLGPPLEFDYSAFEPGQRRFVTLSSEDLPALGGDLVLADLTGGGAPDIVEVGGIARVWRNVGGGFGLANPLEGAPAGIALSDPGVQLLDANGDGRPDLVTDAGFYPTEFRHDWDAGGFRPYDLAPSFDLKDPEVRLLDLDGDGVTDAIRAGLENLELYFNDPVRGWSDVRMVARAALDDFPNVDFADPRVQWADMTGDGLQDLVVVYDGRIDFWPSLGRGDWGARQTMKACPRLPDGYDPRRLLLGDVDGDGAADLVYVEDGTVTLWPNRCGMGWSEPVTVRGTPSISDIDSVRIADVEGSGIGGVLWSRDPGSDATGALCFLDFTGGVKPYLLTEMRNGMGATTQIDYAPSTRYFLEDEREAATRWRTPLPFPVQVVARVQTIDALSAGRLVSTYRYRHGYWDGVDREFRGFGRVDQRDAERLEGDVRATPPVETRTWFHLGPVSHGQPILFDDEYWREDPPFLPMVSPIDREAVRALRGRTLRSESYALDGTDRGARPYAVQEEAHEAIAVEGVFTPRQRGQRETLWERGDDPLTKLRFWDDFDAFGQARSETQIAVPRGRDYRRPAATAEPYLATRRTTRYATPEFGVWLFNRAAERREIELENDGSLDALTLAHSPATGKILDLFRIYYDGPAFEGLPLGRAGSFGAEVRTERLAVDEGMPGSDRPPYLDPSGTPVWTADYPLEFRTFSPPLAGYVFRREADFAGYFVQEARAAYDFQSSGQGGRGVMTASRDPLGNERTWRCDVYGLFVISAVDPLGLETTFEPDYRVLQPRQRVDPLGHTTLLEYDGQGRVVAVARLARNGEGDSIAVPGTRYAYDLRAFVEERGPASIRTTRRVYHTGDASAPAAGRNDVLEQAEFYDGFGRVLQTRVKAEDVAFDAIGISPDLAAPVLSATGATITDRVVATGTVRYDDKGRVVARYEPYFSRGWDYSPPGMGDLKARATFVYDPRGELVRTVYPDGSEKRVVRGRPFDLKDPDHYSPSPWETYTYDENDDAGRTHGAGATGYRGHWNTPESSRIDALGRTVETVERLESLELRTLSFYDLKGRRIELRDPLGRRCLVESYDLVGRIWRSDGLDAGVRRTIFDAAGNVIESRSANGGLTLQSFDPAQRKRRRWARDVAGETVTLRERLVYGDAADSGLTPAQAKAANLRGRLYRHYDEAGRLTNEAFDFRGNVTTRTRQPFKPEKVVASFTPRPAGWVVPAFRADWMPPAGSDLTQLSTAMLGTAYATTIVYDGLNRVRRMKLPADVSNKRAEIATAYNEAGALTSVTLDGKAVVSRIAYNARGQRVLVAYGNGLMTRLAHDPERFRLLRIRTERFTVTGLTYRPLGNVVQDTSTEYDLVGNPLTIRERSPKCGLPATPDRLDRVLGYDARYRLVSATGRECTANSDSLWDGSPACTNAGRTRAYAESYEYDAAGNLRRLRHQATGGPGEREMRLVAGANRLAAMVARGTTIPYAYDAAGHLTLEGNSRAFEWDHSDRLRVYRTQTPGSEPSEYARHLYDAAGQRVMTVVRKQGGGLAVTVAIDGLFESYATIRGGQRQESSLVHVLDGTRRLMSRRAGPELGDTGPATRYYLADPLESSVVVAGADGQWTSREEYSPYGETTFGGFARKRYRFAGKERDDGSGLYYFGARYYAPWLGRWTSPDPAGTSDGTNLFAFVRGNPMRLVDPKGTTSQEAPACNPSTASTSGASPPDRSNAISALSSAGELVEGLGQVRQKYVETAQAARAGAKAAVEAGAKSFAEAARGASELRYGAKMAARADTPAPIGSLLALRDRIVTGSPQGTTPEALAAKVARGESSWARVMYGAGKTNSLANSAAGTARAIGPLLSALSLTFSVAQIGEGVMAIGRGQSTVGMSDVVAGVSQLGVTFAASAAIAAGTVAVGTVGLVALAAGVAITLWSETMHAQAEGRATPLERIQTLMR